MHSGRQNWTFLRWSSAGRKAQHRRVGVLGAVPSGIRRTEREGPAAEFNCCSKSPVIDVWRRGCNLRGSDWHARMDAANKEMKQSNQTLSGVRPVSIWNVFGPSCERELFFLLSPSVEDSSYNFRRRHSPRIEPSRAQTPDQKQPRQTVSWLLQSVVHYVQA